jgi:hypothetical protein
MEKPRSLATDEGRTEYERILETGRISYTSMGVTQDIELAVIKHLEALGVLTYCAVNGKCEGGCPAGQGCITSTTGNCLCSVKFTQ